jgi:homoserine kinase
MTRDQSSHEQQGKRFDITVPGSIANLGPGFDTLAVAVQLYLRLKVEVVPGKENLDFCFADQTLTGENYIERAFRFLARQTGASLPSLKVEVRSEIPMRAGLGSSAAATVAGLRLFEALNGPLPSQAMLNAACYLEGHPDNAAAALLGGLTASCQLPDGSAYAASFPWPQSLAFVVLTPDMALATSEARRVLPTHIPRADVIFNLQRLALFLQLLHSGNFGLLKQAMSDRLHQPYRQHLVPGLEAALHLEHEDLLGVCLSGAGPSIVAVAERNLKAIETLLANTYEPLDIPYEIRTLRAHPSHTESEPAYFAGACCASPGPRS